MAFEIGQKVVCIDDSGQIIKLISYGNTYQVCNTKRCCTQSIGVGFTSQTLGGIGCQYCGRNLSPFGGERWYCSSRFAPIDDWQAAEEAKNELIEEYEESIKVKK